MIFLPGSVALKAISTTTVFPRIQETHRTKVMPKAVCLNMQDHGDGRPIKVREQRKQRLREKSSRKLSSELLALTMGVHLWRVKMKRTLQVQKEPSREMVVRVMPMVSLKDRNSTALGTQAVMS